MLFWFFFAQKGLKMFPATLLPPTHSEPELEGRVLTPLIPQQGDRQCADWSHDSCRRGSESTPFLPLPLPVSYGSGDNLWLPGLAGHLGATLRDDRRTSRGLAVQTEAADHVLQSRAFGFPLLQGEDKTGKHVVVLLFHLRNDEYQHNTFTSVNNDSDLDHSNHINGWPAALKVEKWWCSQLECTTGWLPTAETICFTANS